MSIKKEVDTYIHNGAQTNYDSSLAPAGPCSLLSPFVGLSAPPNHNANMVLACRSSRDLSTTDFYPASSVTISQSNEDYLRCMWVAVDI